MASSENPKLESQLVVSTPNDRLAAEPLALRSETSEPVVHGEAEPQSFPPRDPVWTGWDVLLLALLTIITLLAAEFLTVLGAWVFVYRHISFVNLLQKPALSLLGEFLGYIAVATYMVMLVEGKYHLRFREAIHWNWPKTGLVILGWAALGMFTVSLDLLGRYLPMPKTSPFEEFFSHPRDAYFVAVFSVTLGPLMEELFFRGFLYPVLVRRTGVAVAVLLTSIPFGLVHYLQYRSWAAVLIVTLVGVVLTLVRAGTGSVAASFLVHVGYNGTLMMITALATDGFRHMQKAVVTAT